MKRNPKQVGSNLYDCRTQVGKCKMNCSQCFYNRPGAFYCDIDKPQLPSPKTVGHGIVRMNCGHDSNYQILGCIKQAKKYENFFFNTSIPQFNFPGPVVFTANKDEEVLAQFPLEGYDVMPQNLMFVRLRVSASNLQHIDIAVRNWALAARIPVVLTFMAYYEKKALQKVLDNVPEAEPFYEWKKRHINSYYCPTRLFKRQVMRRMKKIGGRLVTLCGTLFSDYCRDCRNCESYYWITKKHMLGI